MRGSFFNNKHVFQLDVQTGGMMSGQVVIRRWYRPYSCDCGYEQGVNIYHNDGICGDNDCD